MRFLLSIHDVWPGNFRLAADYLARLRSLGASRVALLVVPAYHGGTPMESDPEFLAWLRAEAAGGNELFLHGFYHKMIESVPEADAAARGGSRSAWGRFVNRKLVLQEAEFCGLPHARAARLLELGLAAWDRAGLPLTGFVAPTWHGSPPVRLLREHRLGLWETRFRLQRLEDGASRFAPPIAWDLSSPDAPRLFGGGAWLNGLKRLPLIKVAIHPGDFEGPGTEAVLKRVFAAGENIAYADVFGTRPSQRPARPVPG